VIHLEGGRHFFCLCGVGGRAEELDAHFLAVFTRSDSIGRDGNKHERLARDDHSAMHRAGHCPAAP
jgi:hypothetical protein